MQHNERGSEMMSWLPWYYGDSRIMNEIIHAQSEEIVAIREKVLYVLEQFYVDTADESGISLWEKELGVNFEPGDSLELRKAQVKAKLHRPPIMTPQQLERIINLFLKNPTAKITEIPKSYHFQISIPGGDITDWWGRMVTALEEAKPAHLGYDVAIAMDESLALRTAFALPLSTEQGVEIEPVKKGIHIPANRGFLADDPLGGIRIGLPVSTRGEFFLNLCHSPLLPRRIEARNEPIEIPDRLGGEELSLFHGMMLWELPSAIHTKLPQNGTAGLFMSIRASPVMEKAAEAALPRRETQCGLSISLLASPFLPRHVKAAALPEPIHWEPPEGGTLAHHAGFLAGGVHHGIGMAMPKGAAARQTVGILAGEILPRHVRERND